MAMLAEVLALLQRETGELWGGGIAEAPGGHDHRVGHFLPLSIMA
jgi:hypothetical protein